MIISPTPTLLVHDPAPVCEPNTVNLAAAAVTAGSGAGLSFSYWRNQACSQPLTNYTSVATSGTYWIRAENQYGCTKTEAVNVIVSSLPHLVINDPSPVCSPETVDLTAAYITMGSYNVATLTYWTNAAATNPLANPAAVLNSGTYYIKASTSAGCPDIKPVVVTILPGPQVVINNPAAVCAPETVDLSDPAITAGSETGLVFSYWKDQLGIVPLNNYSNISVSGTYWIKVEGGTSGSRLLIWLRVKESILY